MPKDIKHTWSFEHPKEVVWEYLTDPSLLSQWLMETNFKPIVGHKFQLYAKPSVKMRFDGNIYCEVLEIIPFKKLSFSWKGGPSKEKVTLDSVVTWELFQTEKGTDLVLEHKGFKGLRNFVGYVFMNEGWKSKIKKRLIQLVNERSGVQK